MKPPSGTEPSLEAQPTSEAPAPDAAAQSPSPAQAPPPPEPAFDGAALAKSLLRTIRAGALATIEAGSGHPLATLVSVATDHDGSPILLMSTLSAHTANLDADPRCSILLSRAGKGDPLAHPRLTVIGGLARSGEPRLRERFLARHPKAALYADFGDFSFWRMAVAGAHLNGGFARAMRLGPTDLLTDIAGADDLLDNATDAVAHMNADHRDALALYATVLAKAPQADWRASGVDPEGIDLICGDLAARVAFPERVHDAHGLRKALIRLAREARSRTP